MRQIGSMLLGLGFLLALIGGTLLLAPKIPFLGRLPGDFVFRSRHTVVHFPLATCILLSLLLTLILNLLGLFFHR